MTNCNIGETVDEVDEILSIVNSETIEEDYFETEHQSDLDHALAAELFREAAGRNYTKRDPLLKRALRELVLDRSLVSNLIGPPGSKKSTSIEIIAALYDQFGTEKLEGIYAIGPNLNTASDLRDDLQPFSVIVSTLEKYFTSHQINREEPGSRVVILDEAGLVNATDMYKLIAGASEYRDKVYLVGDPVQKNPRTGRAVFDRIIQENSPERLLRIYRQHTDGSLIDVIPVARQNVEGALKRLDERGSIVEIEDKNKRLEALIDHYSRSQLLITNKRENLVDINKFARSKLKKDGEIGRRGASEVRTTTRGFDGEIRSLNFTLGDRIRFTLPHRVINGSQQPPFAESIQHQENSSGEPVLRPWSEAEVVDIFDGFLEIDHENYSQNLKLGPLDEKSLGIDHAYAITSSQIQGRKDHEVLYYCPADSSSFRDLYVAMSRARRDISIFTDCKNKLMSKLKSTDPDLRPQLPDSCHDRIEEQRRLLEDYKNEHPADPIDYEQLIEIFGNLLMIRYGDRDFIRELPVSQLFKILKHENVRADEKFQNQIRAKLKDKARRAESLIRELKTLKRSRVNFQSDQDPNLTKLDTFLDHALTESKELIRAIESCLNKDAHQQTENLPDLKPEENSDIPAFL